MDEADHSGPPDQDTRKTQRPLDGLHEEHERQHATLQEALRSSAARGGDAADRAARAAELVWLNAEGNRLHAEDLRLQAEREQGVHDRAAQAHWFAALLAHREALRRYRGGV